VGTLDVMSFIIPLANEIMFHVIRY